MEGVKRSKEEKDFLNYLNSAKKAVQGTYD